MTNESCSCIPTRAARPQPGPTHQGIFCWCSAKVLFFLTVLLAATVGLILGAVFARELLAALSSLIVAAVILAVIIIGLQIFRLCMCCKPRRCE